MMARPSWLLMKSIALCVAIGAVSLAGSETFAQNNNGGFLFNRVVGGVQVDAQGVLTGEMQRLPQDLQQKLSAGLNAVDNDINAPGMRIISLKGLNAAMQAALENNEPVPADVQFLAGLQRIEFVICRPEENDVLLAGPAEGWKVNEVGNVVGVKSGMPVLKLEDLIVALKSVNAAREGQGISVSIDPTEQGVQRYNQFVSTLKGLNENIIKQAESVMGQHTISLTGVPADSRYAQILVAADYKMKRLSMGLEQSPISKFPSILEMAQQKDASNIGQMAPRFWMECSYEPMAKSEDGNIWQLRGQGVKTMTEEQVVTRNGEFKKSDKVNKFAEQWASNMTERFDELSAAEPVFRELRNVMDMSVVAALIAKEGLLQKAGLSLSNLDGSNEQVSLPSWQTPKTVPTSCSFIRTSKNWIVTASGGVQVDSWSVASRSEVVAKIATPSLNPTADRWWWNAN